MEDLGKISKIYPVVERGLMEPRPEGVFISTEEVYFFLKETLYFREGGFGVLVPPGGENGRKEHWV